MGPLFPSGWSSFETKNSLASLFISNRGILLNINFNISVHSSRTSQRQPVATMLTVALMLGTLFTYISYFLDTFYDLDLIKNFFL